MRDARCTLLLLVMLVGLPVASGQPGSLASQSSLQPGVPIERTLAAGQTHTFNISLKQDQFLELVVDQRGIDVGVRVVSPAGRRVGDFDSSNGAIGPEKVTVIANDAGQYRIEVTPLDQFRNPLPGRYEIKVVDIRKATDQELKTGRGPEALKVKGLALLDDATVELQRLGRSYARATYQIQMAKLLWGLDESRASKIAEQAAESVKVFMSNPEETERDTYSGFQSAMQLQRGFIDAVAPHEPEMALNFLRSTRELLNPDTMKSASQLNQELQLQLTLANLITATNPKRAFQIAEDSLKEGAPQNMTDTLQRLRAREPDLAARLAHDVVVKLVNEKLVGNPENAYLASNFVQNFRPAGRNPVTSGPNLISEEEFRVLFQKMLSESLAYSMPASNTYTPERSAAQNLINAIRQMSSELQKYAPDRVAAVEMKWMELNPPGNAQLQNFTNAVNNGTIDAGLAIAEAAPRELRQQLYQQIANKAVNAGNLALARQIISDQIADPVQRQQALTNIDRQWIYNSANRGKVEEALRGVSNFRPAAERMNLLNQIVSQIGPGLKRSTTLMYLEQVRSMIGGSGRAEDQQQMNLLLTLGGAFSRLDSIRAFEIVEPLVSQLNEISTSAIAMNGFRETYYRDGELITNNGNVIGQTADQLANALGNLSLSDFERARGAADQIRLVDVRLHAYLAIAQQAISPNPQR